MNIYMCKTSVLYTIHGEVTTYTWGRLLISYVTSDKHAILAVGSEVATETLKEQGVDK